MKNTRDLIKKFKEELLLLVTVLIQKNSEKIVKLSTL